jgi:hypothetical protein
MTRAFEPKPDNIAVAQLVHLHADLGGKLLACQAQASRLASDMRHVEAVIRMFDPTYDMRRIAMKRRRSSRSPFFKRGTMFREAVGVMRAAESPLTTREIAVRLLAAKRVIEPTGQQMKDLIAGVRASLEHHEGKAVERAGEGMPSRWKLAKEMCDEESQT